MKLASLLGIMLVCLVVTASAQEPITLHLHQEIPSIDLSSMDIEEVLTFLTEKYGVPIANEASDVTTRKRACSCSTFQLKNATVEDILNAVINQRPELRWEVVDGVIRISSISDSEPLFEAVVAEFNVKNQTIAEIKRALEDRPEVQAALSENKTEFTEMTVVPGGVAVVSGKYTLALRNATIRQILNQLILLTNGHYWTLLRFGDGKQIWIVVR